MLATRFAWRNPCSVNPIASITRSAEAMKATSSSLSWTSPARPTAGRPSRASAPGVRATPDAARRARVRRPGARARGDGRRRSQLLDRALLLVGRAVLLVLVARRPRQSSSSSSSSAERGDPPARTIRTCVPGAISTVRVSSSSSISTIVPKMPAGRHDLVAHLDAADQGLLRLRSPLLRTDQEEVEDAADQDQRQERGERAAARRILREELDHASEPLRVVDRGCEDAGPSLQARRRTRNASQRAGCPERVTPRWRYARSVATRPRGVRCRNPSCSR